LISKGQIVADVREGGRRAAAAGMVVNGLRLGKLNGDYYTTRNGAKGPETASIAWSRGGRRTNAKPNVLRDGRGPKGERRERREN
jgi:hypothetical protein